MKNSQMSIQFHTFGCKVNTYDTGLMQKRMLASGMVLESEAPEIHVLNSCAVTQEATREAGRWARRLKRKSPQSTVVLTGCAAQVDGNLLDDVQEIDLVIANSHKEQMSEILEKYFSGQLKERVFRSSIFKKEELGLGGGLEAHQTRSFLKIQDGCNSFCSFCIIPFARGKSRSLPPEKLVNKINELHKQGVQEVVLTGVHIGDYEYEKFDLSGLVGYVLEQTQVPRLRLSSLEPIELTPSLVDLYRDPRMCPHFHMSLQHLDSDILTSMKRKYGQKEVVQSLETIKKINSNAFIGMDIIVGFPGETEEVFSQTLKLFKQLPWSKIHVFPYSEREGTRGPHLENAVPISIRKERARQLRSLSHQRWEALAKDQIGLKKKVLILKNQKAESFKGLSRDYWDLSLRGTHSMNAIHRGQEVDVKVIGYEENTQNGQQPGLLIGEVIPRGLQ